MSTTPHWPQIGVAATASLFRPTATPEAAPTTPVRTLVAPTARVTFPDAPPQPLFGPYPGVDTRCHWARIPEPAGGTNQIGVSRQVVDNYYSPIPGGADQLLWRVWVWSGTSVPHRAYGVDQLKVTRYLQIHCSHASTHEAQDYWYSCSFYEVAPRKKTFGVGAFALLSNPQNRAEINAAIDLLAFYDVNAPSRDSLPVVIAFQNAYNASGLSGHLTPDGQYGPNTQRALQNVMQEAQDDAGGGPAEAAPSNVFSASIPATPTVDVTPVAPSAPTTPVVVTPSAPPSTPTNYTPYVVGGAAAAAALAAGIYIARRRRKHHA